MHHIDTVVIGAGHAGLAVSRLLTAAGHEHVVLDRGRVAERWRSERWDSLHLLTPNWMTRLPGFSYRGPDPDGHLPAHRLVRHLETYAASFRAPVLTDTGVRQVARSGDGYRVDTDRGGWTARSVVIATGPGEQPHLPDSPWRPDPGVHVLPASRYRNPQLLPPGRVLVVGASSSGVQVADELARAGREVVVAVGRHTRVPRSYRGMDLFWWLERTGRLARTIDEVADVAAARREPSLQLVGRGTPGQLPADLDLATLQARGVRLTGRVAGIEGTAVRLQDDLGHSVGDAERRLERLLDSVDRHIDEHGLTAEVWPARRPRPVPIPRAPTRVDLRGERHRHGPACHGPPSAPPVAAGAGHRGGRVDFAVPGRDPCARPVCRGPTLPAPTGTPAFSTAPATTLRRSWVTCAEPGWPGRGSGHGHDEPLRRRHRRWPRGRGFDRPPAGPGRGPGGPAGAVTSRKRHGVHARADARRRPAAVPLGPAARPGPRRHPTDPADAVPLRRRRPRSGVHPPQPGCRRPVRPSPARPRHAAGGRGCGGRCATWSTG